MKNILLVSPDALNEALWVTGEEDAICDVRNNFPPLGLATVAGLTPKDGYHVQLWDEIVHGKITDDTVFDRQFDLVGVTGYDMHRPRQIEVAKVFQKRGIPACVGGPGSRARLAPIAPISTSCLSARSRISGRSFCRIGRRANSSPNTGRSTSLSSTTRRVPCGTRSPRK